jgi:choice-of-anchor B domain-containing protein
MKFTAVLAAAAVGATTVLAGEAGVRGKMEHMMDLKTKQWDEARAKGMFGGSKLYKKHDRPVRCRNGYAGEYQCNNVDMMSFLSHEDMGSETMEGNDIWGWAQDGREFGLVGQTDGTAFVEINKYGSLEYLGRLDTHTTNTSWRDIKVIKNHAYIGSEAPDHGLQIFDLTKLMDLKKNKPWWQRFTPVVFDIYNDVTAHFDGFGASHNIVAHEEVDMIYAVGGREGENARNTTCAGGMFMVDVSDPASPWSPGCVGIDGYVHDAQCVIYKGPSTQFTGREICFGYNEDTLTIYDMTDKQNVQIISKTDYVGNEYTHQGWLISDDMNYLLLDDELDELNQAGPPAGYAGGELNHTTTYIFDVSDITAPVYTGFYQSPAKSIDHNQYTLKGLSYQANYGSGLRVIDVSGIPSDPTGGNIEETGFFDCHPEDDDVNGVVEFLGTWGVYPYLPSGYVLLNSIERGVYVLKYNGRGAKY